MRILDDFDSRYDPQVRMPWCHAGGPGYHTLIPRGTRAHQTKDAADYTLALLQDASATRVARAHDVLDVLLGLQVTDPAVPHYGLWGWFAQEAPEQMAPADWNWADFIGVRLAQVLAVHGKQLEPDLRAEVRNALRHATMSILRRNVEADYTNIAVMGAVATAAAGEILGDDLLLDYANRRLTEVLELRRRVGGFTEYNSPWYHRVVLEELERSALIVADRSFGELAEELRHLTWTSLAERFHPGTGQLAGPISRAYNDRLTPELAEYFTVQTGPATELVPPKACPESIAPRFRALPSSPLQLRTRFSEQVVGTTWLTDEACLGSAGEEFAWTQRRPLLGYWRTPEDPAVVLRARMLLDGHDLSAAWCRQAQDGCRVLSAWWLSYDSGDFHPALDKPENSVFRLADLRLAVSIRGNGVHTADLGNGLFALGAGGWKALVHTAQAAFLGEPVSWRASNLDGEARVEAVLYQGVLREVDFHHADVRAAFALELLESSEPATTSFVSMVSDMDDEITWRWSDLSVTVPAHPTPFDRS